MLQNLRIRDRYDKKYRRDIYSCENQNLRRSSVLNSIQCWL